MSAAQADDGEGGPGPPPAATAASASHESLPALPPLPSIQNGDETTSSATADADLPFLPPLPAAKAPLAPSGQTPSPSGASITLPHLSSILDAAATIDYSAADDADLRSTVPPTSSSSSSGLLSSGVAVPASPPGGSNLRQLALYQALLARGQVPESHPAFAPSFPPPPGHAPFGPLSTPAFHLPHAPPPTPNLPLHQQPASPGHPSSTLAEDAAMPPASHKWHTSLEGLNVVPDPVAWPAAGTAGPAAGLSNISTDELLAAQASLDLWASTAFPSPGMSPTASLAPGSTPLTSQGPLLPSLSSAAVSSVASPSAPPASLDWSTLYPHGSSHFSPPRGAPLSLPSTSALGLAQHLVHHAPHPSAHHAHHSGFAPPPPAADSPFSSLFGRYGAPPSTAHGDGAKSSSGSPPPTGMSLDGPGSFSRPAPSRRSSRANAGAKGRAARASLAGSGEGESEDGDGSAGDSGVGLSASGSGGGGMAKKIPRELMTAEEVEEDKRRRNTEASARFRAKKKLRDQELQQSSAQLRERVASLEKEKESLTNENRWLRDIVAEKAEVQPHLLDVLRRSSLES
ncbi:hypothetical protein JCM8097_000281 [Rhodosporidiobolus ruineniae]